SDLPFVLMSDNVDAFQAALEKEGGHQPVLNAATIDNWEAMAAVAKKGKASLVVRSSDGLEELADLTNKLSDAGVADLV
ncbi:MAG: acetyl-CoA decarbonylase/synthase complex subunit gamma, partial [Anaerolineae bacterium]|nr:acetyl-CoA decarbonylase/synthase complex subunit gamma [Anaerolineae bacterium]